MTQGNPFAFERCRRSALRCLFIVLSPNVASATCVASSDALPPLLPVATNVWRVPAAGTEPDPTNGGATIQLVLVRDGMRLWLVGSGPTPAFGAALACAIERMTGRQVTDVVNTRAAPELALGNFAFPRARLWALPDVIVAMRARCAQCQDQLRSRIGAAGESLHPDRIRAPTLAVGRATQATGRLGPFVWHALPRRRGERTLVLRHRGIVIAQGLLWPGDVPDLRDTHAATMTTTLHRLRGLSSGAMLLGERGAPAAAAQLDSHLAYLEGLRNSLASQLGSAEGASVSADLPAFAGLPGYPTTHPLNVQRMWRELELELFR